MTLSSLFVFIVENGEIQGVTAPPISVQLSFKVTVESSWQVSSKGKEQEIDPEPVAFIKGWGGLAHLRSLSRVGTAGDTWGPDALPELIKEGDAFPSARCRLLEDGAVRCHGNAVKRN